MKAEMDSTQDPARARLQQISERHTAASPGDWSASGNGVHVGIRCVAITDMDPREQRQADALFIAAAHSADVPALLAAVTAILDLADQVRSKMPVDRVLVANRPDEGDRLYGKGFLDGTLDTLNEFAERISAALGVTA